MRPNMIQESKQNQICGTSSSRLSYSRLLPSFGGQIQQPLKNDQIQGIYKTYEADSPQAGHRQNQLKPNIHPKQFQQQYIHQQRTDPNTNSDNSIIDLQDDDIRSEDSLENYMDDFEAEGDIEQQDDELTLYADISDYNELIQIELMKCINNKECSIGQNVILNYNGNIIKLSGLRNEVEEAEQEVKNMLTNILQRYVKDDLDLNEKEVAYFNKNLCKKKSQLETKYNCKIRSSQQNIQQQNQSQAQVALELSYQNKCFKIVQGDIQEFKTEVVVNTANQQLAFGNPSMQTGVAKKLQQLGGIRYEQACKNFISMNKQLQFGTVFSHHHNAVLIQYILTIATPNYESGSQTEQDLLIIRSNIEAVFKMADQLKIKDITFPVIGGGTSGFNYDSAAQTVISAVIDALFLMNTNVLTANIIEIDAQRVSELLKLTTDIINQQPKRQVKYQWQWMDGVFQDYDDQEINEQIDIAYDEYLINNSKNSIKLIFPYTKSPGTHVVNLSKKTVTDIKLKTVSSITLGQHSGIATYFFNNQPVHRELNEQLFRQVNLKIDQFEIFYKRHKIVFSNQQIKQINEDTNYCREVRHIAYSKPQQSVKGFALNGKKYKLVQFSLNSIVQQVSKSTISLEVIGRRNFNKIGQGIQKMIRSNFITMIFSIPNIENADSDALIQMINNHSLDISGQMAPGQKVTILVDKKMQQQIDSHISQSELRKSANDQLKFQLQLAIPAYPNEWSAQQLNFIKVELAVNQNEYQKIQQIFAASDKGKIHKIYRIQNKILWEHYAAEKQKLINRYERNNQKLSPQELELYVWHGVSSQHPSIIYTSEIDAFDSSYSRDGCSWGPGIYFAQKALYSRQYSYNLKALDDLNYQNKKVFLCCLITTGRVKVCQADGNLRRPPEGFDCISGGTGSGDAQSTIYVLYQMQVRRAYPAYEVIYE